jgi:hypothetical protein
MKNFFENLAFGLSFFYSTLYLYIAKNKKGDETMPRGRKKKQELEILRLPMDISDDLLAVSSGFMYNYVHDETFHKWSLTQKKLFALVLDKIDWSGKNNNIIQLKNEEVAKELGWDFSRENIRSVGADIKRDFSYMAIHSGVNLQDPYSHKWVSGNFICHATGDSMYTNVVMNPLFMPHFERLYENAGKSGRFFYTMVKPDIVKCDCYAGHELFMWMRSKHMKKGIGTYSHTFGTKELKDIFGLPIDAYMRDIDSETGEYRDFNRSMFEKAVLIKAILSVNKSEQVQILKQSNGAYFKKEKEGRRVTGYTMTWRVLDNDAIAKRRAKKLEKIGISEEYLMRETPDSLSKIIEVEDDYSDLFE